jgi:hypothetical protein
VPHLLLYDTSVYMVSEGLSPTFHSGIRTCDVRIIRSLLCRSFYCATRATVINMMYSVCIKYHCIILSQRDVEYELVRINTFSPKCFESISGLSPTCEKLGYITRNPLMSITIQLKPMQLYVSYTST